MNKRRKSDRRSSALYIRENKEGAQEKGTLGIGPVTPGQKSYSRISIGNRPAAMTATDPPPLPCDDLRLPSDVRNPRSERLKGGARLVQKPRFLLRHPSVGVGRVSPKGKKKCPRLRAET